MDYKAPIAAAALIASQAAFADTETKTEPLVKEVETTQAGVAGGALAANWPILVLVGAIAIAVATKDDGPSCQIGC